jgi:trehalose synthase
MLQPVDVGELALSAYHGLVPDDLLESLRIAAEPLRGLRVLHLNATAYGGGVSELLRSVVPLLNGLGLHADWRVITGDPSFFSVTKTIHNALQGGVQSLTDKERALYLSTAEQNARAVSDGYDVVMVHDPQLAPLPHFCDRAGARWIWRCHIDTSAPNPAVWELLRPYLAVYDAAVFTMPEFVPPDLPIQRVKIIPPAIDPLSPKNLELPDRLARQVLNWVGMRLDRPLITQVSRFDRWKDPLGVIAAYRLARQEFTNLQLALVGSMALDDPEAWEVYREIEAAGRSDPLIHVFTNLTGVGNVEVNAFQRLSEVVVQKSIREGFGLVVSEALWKGTPVVAGRTGGIPLQMDDGVGGYLVNSVEGCADAILRLLRDPEAAKAIAARGREWVRGRFLIPRLVRDELSLIHDLVAASRTTHAGD